MQATSYYLVFIELLLAGCGGIYFLYQASLKKQHISAAVFFVALLTLITVFWFDFNYAENRWLGLKTALFLCCLYFASKYPRPSMLLLSVLALSGFLIDFVMTGELLSKHVGLSINGLLPIPFTLIFCTFLLSRRDDHINMWLLLLVASTDIFLSFFLDARAAVISALLVAFLLLSPKISKGFVKFGLWIPFAYLIVVLLSYYSMLFNFDLIPRTPSNFERSAMIFAAIGNFFDYLFIGPRSTFDQMAGAISLTFNWVLYKDEGGVDPHFFFLSLWRDVGAFLTLCWIGAWLYYWRVLNSMRNHFDTPRMRVVLGLLAISIVQFCTTPPNTGKRLLVAMIMGAALGFARERMLANDRERSDHIVLGEKSIEYSGAKPT